MSQQCEVHFRGVLHVVEAHFFYSQKNFPYPLHNDTRKIEICVTQGLCSNGESVTDVPPVIVSNTFAPFSREIEYAAGQKIIASAKGYPQENESCWI